MQELVIHLLMFTGVVVLFLLVPLLIGKLIRPKLPTPEKDAIYECGEPTIGTSYIQFDLRFYVVALLFIIFDVEVAFFFPWAMVYGGATQLADQDLQGASRIAVSEKLLEGSEGAAASGPISSETALTLAHVGMMDILVFFGVLLVGFAYVWKRGDLDWVRAMTESAKRKSSPPQIEPQPDREPEPDPVSV